MKLVGEAANHVRLLIFVPLSLIIVWSIARLCPSPARLSTEFSHRLPSVKIDYHPNRDPRTNYNQSKLALLIETRPLAYITPLLLHMIAVVPPDWRFMYIGSAESVAQVTTSLPVGLHQASGKLDVMESPAEFPATSGKDVNKMLTDPRFYDELVHPAEWLLVFHSDSIMCANAHMSLDDWLSYDWVGAPWGASDSFSGQGGLSLRRVSRIKQVLHFQTHHAHSKNEDQWLIDRLGLLPDARMANASVAAAFCVADLWHDRPLGYHLGASATRLPPAVWADLARRKAIYEYCPEIKMIVDMKLERQRCPVEESPPHAGRS